jgi:MFS family permease
VAGPDPHTPPTGARWRTLAILAVGELCIMALWFSASAVTPQLAVAWDLDGAAQSWLTISVQIGFVVGALGSAVLNLADRFTAHRLIATSAVLGAACTAAIAIAAPPFPAVIALRFLTGVTLAGVYPPGMKVLASWFDDHRGLAIGVMVGALAIGSATPHALSAVSVGNGGAAAELAPWRPTMLGAAALAVLGALLTVAFVRPGPLLARASHFHWRHAGIIWTDRPVRLANFGYLGHMWELYAVWTWVPVLLLASYERAGWSPVAARVAGFALIAAGGIGSAVAGRLADRTGRTVITTVSLVVSGACCLVAGFTAGMPGLLTVICLIWGLAVVADSAQFSTAVSELADPRYVGTALTIQTCTGFLLTLVTIRLLPPLVDLWGWGPPVALLALGPLFGIWSMLALRRRPEAARMAGGRR